MGNTAISVVGLGKEYQIRGPSAPYSTLRDSFVAGLTAPARRVARLLRGKAGAASDLNSAFWALRDIEFSIEHGEVLGIIGRNGAGKSTLLKILSRITEPSRGVIDIYGRVGSLLEVGTGFHPELSGRENVFLNGAILGMQRHEITARFDEIVDFSGVEKFIDTPVKHYSSGMQVRLAFAVAAHLEPEILLVDEVLAVGDAIFQRKCLGKMNDVARQGRTVLFVSHNMPAVTRLCTRAILLHEGRLIEDASPEKTIHTYLQQGVGSGHEYAAPPNNSLPMYLQSAQVSSEGQIVDGQFPRHYPVKVSVTFRVNKPVAGAHIYAKVMTFDDTIIFGSGDTDLDSSHYDGRQPGEYHCYFEVPARILNEGDYKILFTLGIPYGLSYQRNVEALSFSIVDVEKADNYIHQRRAGMIRLDIPWVYQQEVPVKTDPV